MGDDYFSSGVSSHAAITKIQPTYEQKVMVHHRRHLLLIAGISTAASFCFEAKSSHVMTKARREKCPNRVSLLKTSLSAAEKTSTVQDLPSVHTMKPVDTRPHEQRAKVPRKARRMNHSFMHLFRHDSPLFDDQKIALSSKSLTCARTYLREYAGYSDEEIDKMEENFPPLLDLDVKRHLRPKLRFIKHTLEGNIRPRNYSQGPQPLSDVAKSIPPQYFGSRMEKMLAPRHAFLMYIGVPHGQALLENDASLFQDFLISCRRTKTFCALCNKWRKEYGDKYVDEEFSLNVLEEEKGSRVNKDAAITPKQVEAFDSLFLRGIMAASRNDMDPFNQNLTHMNVTAGEMINLLTRHGSNPLETDVRDISLLHWAAGSGQVDALQQLIRVLPRGIEDACNLKADRDGASILHWAAAGAKSKAFGCGGHENVCKFLMENCGGPNVQRDVVNALTKDGNSVLMWAAWSGTLEVVKLMVRHRADSFVKNRNGCSVAHWAASGGNLDLCKYLYSAQNIDFSEGNNAGNTPLSHAVAYGRNDVVKWLKDELQVEDVDGRAEDLAIDLFAWDTIEDGDERKEAFNLFTDWDNEQ